MRKFLSLLVVLLTTFTSSWAMMVVCKNTTTDKEYGTVTKAIEEVAVGQTIQLTRDIDLTAAIDVASSKNFTLDLNGHVLKQTHVAPTAKGEKAYILYIPTNSILNITDSDPNAEHTGDLSSVKGGVLTGGKGYYDSYGDIRAGAIDNYGTFTMTGGTIYGNTASFGGGIYNESGSCTLNGVTLSNNTAASGFGGAIYSKSAASCAVYGCKILNNKAEEGAGIFSNSTNLVVDKYTEGGVTTPTTISGNEAESGGGIIIAGETAIGTISNTTITGNKAICTSPNALNGLGGGVAVSKGKLTMKDVIVTSNEATSYGGGIGSLGGTLIVDGCTITGNKTNGYGGAGIMNVTYATYFTSDITLKGNNVVKDNTNTISSVSSASNLALIGTTVKLDGVTSADATIGVSKLNMEMQAGAVTITPTTGEVVSNCTTNDAKYFFADDADKYKLVYNETGNYLELVEKIASETALKNAISNVTSGGIVKLDGDIALEAELSIVSSKNFTLDLNGHVLKQTAQGASVINNAGTLIIADNSAAKTGQITGGNTTLRGGGIYNTGTLNITGGTIIDNTADKFGGGISNYGGTLNITGGTIKENKAKEGGAGVDNYNNGTITVGGTAVIEGNTITNSTTKNDLALNGSKLTISTTTPLATGAKIGIAASTAGQFTTNGAATDAQYFFADNDDYIVKFVTDHLEIAPKQVDPYFGLESDFATLYTNDTKTIKWTSNSDGEVSVTGVPSYMTCEIDQASKTITITANEGAEDADVVLEFTQAETESYTSATATFSISYKKHNWAEEWDYNEDGHWHNCTIEGCTEKDSYAAHGYGSDKMEQSYYICSTCGYENATRKAEHEEALEAAWLASMIKDIVEKIDAIGTVKYTPECKARIDAARAAINQLSLYERALVPNRQKLYDAEAEYERLKQIATGINDVNADVDTNKNGKFLENGKVVIYRNGRKFNAAGTQIR